MNRVIVYCRRSLIFITYVMLILASGGSGAEPTSPRVVTSLLEMRRSNVVIQEWDLSCGAAALATVLRYQYNDLVTEKEIAKTLIDRKEYLENPKLVQMRQGFSLLDLKRFVAVSYTHLDVYKRQSPGHPWCGGTLAFRRSQPRRAASRRRD